MAKKKIDLGFTPSPYQEKIFDFIQHGVGNAVISACAGSGKTSSIINAMKFIPESKKCLFLAFNKSIAEELTEKLKEQKNVTVRTSHSLGLLMLRRNIGNDIEIDEYKYKTYVKKHISELTSLQETPLTRNQVQDYVENIISLINFSRLNLAQSVKEINEIAAKYDIPISFDECEVALKCLKWGKTNTNIIDYTDMLWLPVELNMKPSGLQYDWVFGDECQDFSILMCELVKKTFKRGTRTVFVGDEYQCQPEGTKIYMTDGTLKNIEDLKIGDKVITYCDKSKSCFKGYNNSFRNMASNVMNIETHCHNGEIITIKTENNLKTHYTPDHLCYAKFNEENCKGKYVLYLMCKNDDMWRIGVTKLFNSVKKNSFGMANRMRQEKCFKGWILDVFDTEKKAKYEEVKNSILFQIPQVIFEQRRTGNNFFQDEDIVNLYNDFTKYVNIKKNAINLLKKYHRKYEHPFHELNNGVEIGGNRYRHGREYLCNYYACNLLPKVMEMMFYDANNKIKRTHGNTNKIDYNVKGRYSVINTIERDIKNINVYSLDIENEHNYVADGILTHNCIYAFCGSNEESFNNICNQPNTTVFELPITYRCGKKITEFANNLVPDIQPRKDAPDGIILQSCSYKSIKDGDMVLARSKAPLLNLYVKLLRRGVNCYIKGQDIGTNLIKMLDGIDEEELNSDLKNDGVFIRLYDRLFNDRNKLMTKRGLDMNDATLSANIMNMYDSINVLLILAEKCKTKQELINKIKNIFQETAKGVCLSTIHKAKGLEADNVYILCHSAMPSKLAKHDWEKVQEKNLQYVAYTRAKLKLGFISEKEIPPSGSMMEPTKILDELKYIENIVCGILGKEPMQPMNSVEMSKFNLRNATEIPDFHASDNSAIITDTYNSNDNTDCDEDDVLLANLLEFMKRGDTKAINKVKEVMDIAQQSRG